MNKIVAFFIGGILSLTSLQAEVKVWTGTNSTLWTEDANWSPVGQPVAEDSLLIPSGKIVNNGQNVFTHLEIEEQAVVTFGNIKDGMITDKSIVVRGTINHNGNGAFRLYNNAVIDLYGTLGVSSDVTWLDVKNSTLNFYDGASFANESLSFQHKGDAPTFGYKLSAEGFKTINAGKLYKGDSDEDWSNCVYNIDISDYTLKDDAGDVIILVDYNAHVDVFNEDFIPTINIISGTSGLDAILTFDVVKSQLVLGVFKEGGTPPVIGPQTISVETDGLSFTFIDAVPTVLKNGAGQNLLNGSQKGFYIKEGNSTRTFDKISKNGDEYTFSMTNYPETFTVEFAGLNDYITVRFKDLSGFELDGERLFFGMSTVGESVQSIALDYMTEASISRNLVDIERICLWEKSNPEKLGAFALYEFQDEAQEDEALLDIWVNAGLPHPKVEGEWTKEAARQWLQDWIKMAYDVSYLNIEPETLDQHYDYLKYAKMMDAKAIYMWNGIWRQEYWLNYRQNDEINPVMYPNGIADLHTFKDSLDANGMNLMFHYLCGNIGEHDPEFVYPTVSDGLHTWGTVSLVNAISAGSSTLIVRPDSGVTIPTIISDTRTYRSSDLPFFYEFKTFRVGNEWLSASNVTDNGDGTYTFSGLSRGKWSTTAEAHSASASMTGYLRPYNQDFVPDPHKALFDTITTRWANLNNSLGLIRASFDGYEIHSGNGKWGNYKFSASVYEKLDHPTSANSSGGAAPRDWIEYRFNCVQDSMMGVFETRETLPIFKGDKSRITPGIEEAEMKLYKSAMVNTRGFSVGSYDVKGVKLSVIEEYGLSEELFALVKKWKDFSLPLPEDERAALNTSFSYNFDGRGGFNGNHPRWSALWRIEAGELRKWYNLGTDIYTNSWHTGQEHGVITPRIYVKNGQEQVLDVPSELTTEVQKVRIIGRILPSVEANAIGNIDLMKYIGGGAIKNISLTNSNASAQWDLDNLNYYPITGGLDLSENRALGMWVTGDNSGATLVVRLHGTTARDYAVPLNFSGKKWVELPTGEQAWRLRSWGYTPSTMKYFNYSKTTGISIGIGHIPGNKTVNVMVEGLTALQEEAKGLENPVITLGESSVTINGIIPTEHHFILDPDGKFTVYDEMWNVVSSQKLPRLLPKDLSTFKMESLTSSKKTWIEVGVQASNESLVISSDFTSNGTPYEWLDSYELALDQDYEKADTMDTDSDGWMNYEEFQNGTNPLVANPMFLNNPITTDTAFVYNSFTYSIASFAKGPEGVDLLFSKVSGPDWLEISSDGEISGTPSAYDQGNNLFVVKVEIEGAGSHSVNMYINVEDALTVIVENVSDGTPQWSMSTIPAPSKFDYADIHQGNDVSVTNVVGQLNSAGGEASVLINGIGQSSNTDFKQSAIFLSSRPSRYVVDLQSTVPIDSIITYSWYREKFWADQEYDLYFFAGEEAPDALVNDLTGTEWNKLTSVETDLSGQIAVCLTSKTNKELVNARYLLWDIKSGTAYGEFDVYVQGYEPKPLSVKRVWTEDDVQVYYSNKQIVIVGDVLEYEVLNMMGQVLISDVTNVGTTYVPFDKEGIFLVYLKNSEGQELPVKLLAY